MKDCKKYFEIFQDYPTIYKLFKYNKIHKNSTASCLQMHFVFQHAE